MKNQTNYIKKNQDNVKSFNYYRNIVDYSTFFNA